MKSAPTGAAVGQGEPGDQVAVPVWDPLLRLFHWSLVLAFAVAWLTTEEGEALHQDAGYVAAGLISFRIFWGLVGPRYARFSQFIRGPQAVMRYLGNMMRGRERRYIGHNPAGAVMILALLASLAGTIYTGWLMAEPARLAQLAPPALVSAAFAEEHEGGFGGEGGEGAAKDLHGALANLTLLLVVLHVAGVALASLRHHENLARSMVTGRKRAAAPGDVA